MSRNIGSIQRLVECRWCRRSIRARTYLRHLRNDCKECPKFSADEKICVLCQEILPLVKFARSAARPDGLSTSCKACTLKKYKQWRVEKKPTHQATLRRPGRWVLKPCKYCGTPYSYNARVKHEPRCQLKPPSRQGAPLKAGVIVPDNTETARTAILAIPRGKAASLKFQYGITMDDWNRMFEAQGGVCAICKGTDRMRKDRRDVLHVDHDHVTGKVRGLVCHMCNVGLGHFGEDVGLLEAAIRYLRSHTSDI